MTAYDYHFEMWDPDEEAVEIPDDAVGITVDSFSDCGTVRYLTPVEEEST